MEEGSRSRDAIVPRDQTEISRNNAKKIRNKKKKRVSSEESRDAIVRDV